MKRRLCLCLLVIFMAACAAAQTQQSAVTIPPKTPLEITPPTSTSTIMAAVSSTPPPPTLTIYPTGAFITMVMGTKYAGRTQFASLPTQTLTPTIPPVSQFCRRSDVRTTFSSNGAGGKIVLQVGVENISRTACFLPAWPVVQLLDRAGKPLDIAYDYIFPDANPSSLPPTAEATPGQPLRFGFQPGQTSVLLLPWGNWCGPGIKGGVIIRVALLGKGDYIDVPTDIQGGGHCDNPGSKSTLDILGFPY